MKKIFLLLLLLPFLSNAQTITTIAGSGPTGSGGSGGGSYSGDGGPATNARLNGPQGVAADTNGNIYIADKYNNRIRKVAADGTITTFAGTGTGGFTGDGGPATAALLSQPIGVAVDRHQNVYIVDRSRIRKVNSAGIITTIAGGIGLTGYYGDGGTATAAPLQEPQAVAIDTVGNVYISDFYQNTIRKVNTLGIISTVIGPTYGYLGDGGPASAARINSPCGIALDNYGNLFIADNNNNVIRKINAAGIITTVAGNGTAYFTGDGGPATAAGIQLPYGISLDGYGNMFISMWINNRVRKINYAGTISTFAGDYVTPLGDGGPATAAGLYAPYACTCDTTGNLYFADAGNDRIRKVTAAVTRIHGPSILCNGSTAIMSNETSGGTWSSTNTAIATINSAGLVNSIMPGIDTIVYTTSAGSVIQIIKVQAQPNTITGTDTICSGTCDTLLAHTNGSTVLWLGTVSCASCDTTIVCPTATNRYSVVATDNVGCTDTSSFVVTVKPTPVLTSAVTLPAVCDSAAILYTPTSSLPGTTFTWSRPSASGIATPAATGTGSINEVLHNNSANPVTITYAYTLEMDGCSSTANLTGVIEPEPLLSSTLTPPAVCDTSIFSYIPISFTAGTTSTWTRAAVAGISNPASSGAGNPNELLVNMTTSPIPVTYVYTLTANGCTHTQQVTVVVNHCVPDGINNTLTPVDDVILSPNPATTTLNVSASQNIASVVISNSVGQIILSKYCSTPQLQIDISSLPVGLYFARLNGIAVYKFIKQ